MEFNVDPLFKKTSADFDEGGAKGLLLNHLSVGKDGRIVFDASEVQSSSAAEEAETATATAASDQRQQLEGESVSQGSLSVDMEKLKGD